MTEESKRQIYFGVKGLRSHVVDIAPEDASLVPASKRKDIIYEEDIVLDKNLTILDDGTKLRNRAFQERLDDVWDSMHVWESKLKTEAIEAAETIQSMRDDYTIQIDKLKTTTLNELNTIFNIFDDDLEPVESERIATESKDLDVFVKKTVPEAIDKQNGALSRKLKKAYETFEIEQQKERKRESKFVGKADEYIQRTAQKFHDEDALMDSCFFNLEDDVNEYERRSARMFLMRQETANTCIFTNNGKMHTTQKKRESEDLEVLDTVIETQQLLQHSVIIHFGSDEGDTVEKDMKFPLLEKRMEQANSRRPSIGGAEGAELAQSARK